jgi:hypothetical protein
VAIVPPLTLRPRSVPELIDASVQLLRHHYIELVSVNALFTAPAIVANILLVWPHQHLTADQVALRTASIKVLSVIFDSVSTAATVVIVSDSYLGRGVTIAAAVSRVLERFWTVLAAAIVQAVFIAFGLILLVVPGIIVASRLFATTTVVMVEGDGVFGAIARSNDLARGSVGRIFVTLLSGLLLVLLPSFALGFGIGMAELSNSILSKATGHLLTQELTILFTPIFQVVVPVLYYDLRIRKEGFDMNLMAKELGFGSAATAGAKAV